MVGNITSGNDPSRLIAYNSGSGTPASREGEVSQSSQFIEALRKISSVNDTLSSTEAKMAELDNKEAIYGDKKIPAGYANKFKNYTPGEAAERAPEAVLADNLIRNFSDLLNDIDKVIADIAKAKAASQDQSAIKLYNIQLTQLKIMTNKIMAKIFMINLNMYNQWEKPTGITGKYFQQTSALDGKIKIMIEQMNKDYATYLSLETIERKNFGPKTDALLAALKAEFDSSFPGYKNIVKYLETLATNMGALGTQLAMTADSTSSVTGKKENSEYIGFGELKPGNIIISNENAINAIFTSIANVQNEGRSIGLKDSDLSIEETKRKLKSYILKLIEEEYKKTESYNNVGTDNDILLKASALEQYKHLLNCLEYFNFAITNGLISGNATDQTNVLMFANQTTLKAAYFKSHINQKLRNLDGFVGDSEPTVANNIVTAKKLKDASAQKTQATVDLFNDNKKLWKLYETLYSTNPAKIVANTTAAIAEIVSMRSKIEKINSLKELLIDPAGDPTKTKGKYVIYKEAARKLLGLINEDGDVYGIDAYKTRLEALFYGPSGNEATPTGGVLKEEQIFTSAPDDKKDPAPVNNKYNELIKLIDIIIDGTDPDRKEGSVVPPNLRQKTESLLNDANRETHKDKKSEADNRSTAQVVRAQNYADIINAINIANFADNKRQADELIKSTGNPYVAAVVALVANNNVSEIDKKKVADARNAYDGGDGNGGKKKNIETDPNAVIAALTGDNGLKAVVDKVIEDPTTGLKKKADDAIKNAQKNLGVTIDGTTNAVINNTDTDSVKKAKAALNEAIDAKLKADSKKDGDRDLTPADRIQFYTDAINKAQSVPGLMNAGKYADALNTTPNYFFEIKGALYITALKNARNPELEAQAIAFFASCGITTDTKDLVVLTTAFNEKVASFQALDGYKDFVKLCKFIAPNNYSYKATDGIANIEIPVYSEHIITDDKVYSESVFILGNIKKVEDFLKNNSSFSWLLDPALIGLKLRGATLIGNKATEMITTNDVSDFKVKQPTLIWIMKVVLDDLKVADYTKMDAADTTARNNHEITKSAVNAKVPKAIKSSVQYFTMPKKGATAEEYTAYKKKINVILDQSTQYQETAQFFLEYCRKNNYKDSASNLEKLLSHASFTYKANLQNKGDDSRKLIATLLGTIYIARKAELADIPYSNVKIKLMTSYISSALDNVAMDEYQELYRATSFRWALNPIFVKLMTMEPNAFLNLISTDAANGILLDPDADPVVKAK